MTCQAFFAILLAGEWQKHQNLNNVVDGKEIPMNSLCDMCKEKEGQGQMCEGDGRLHGHGMVHTIKNGLMWLCDDCADKVKLEWQLAHARQVITL